MMTAVVATAELRIGDLVLFPDGVGPRVWRVGRIEVLQDRRRRVTWVNAPRSVYYGHRQQPWSGVYADDAPMHRVPTGTNKDRLL